MKKEKIYDRKQYLDILEKRIRGLKDGYRQNMAVIGDELVGKTSIIFKFLSKFCDNSILILYLEARPESLDSFARRFIGVLLYNFLVNSSMSLEEDLDFLINRSERFIPKTVGKINLILNATKRRKKNGVFTELFSLCEEIHQESGKYCVVILDEFLNLENVGFKNLYREWSKLLITQKNTMYIIASSLKFRTKNVLSKNLSLLFGNFQVITIDPFDIKTSGEYLVSKLGTHNLDTALNNFIVHFTGGYPLYLEVISDALLKQGQNNIVDILENLLFDSSGILNQRFSNYIKRFLDSSFSNDYISILYLISSGRNKIKTIAQLLRKNRKELALRINHLLELGTITRSVDFLKINDKVFSFWLKFVYQEKLHSLTFDAKNQKELFRDYIEANIQEFDLSVQKPLVERMTELLRLFEDETIQLETKRIRLNHFREIKPLEFNNRNLRDGLIGRSSDSLWIIALKNGLLTEDDITEFAKECKRYRHKLQRKIIVTLGEIDMNTRLRALEDKIWTWDINKLNQILELYSKPWVIA
ncbi:MAG: ATP-binding protein [Candidatus Omnitrophica bacterium]|nr:ATP-binding protein [Candidatus Omnitrophota bacterium]